jgi:hypothetical protein
MKKERLKFREQDKKRIREHKNYGDEDRDFEKRLLETEDYRVEIKKDKLFLLNAKR